MKKLLITALFIVTLIALSIVSASAVTNGTVKVGLKYGSGALFSANLENAVGSGFDFGYYDSSRNFIQLGSTANTAISMTAAGTIYGSSSGEYSSSASAGGFVIGAYHIQLSGAYSAYADAAAAASAYSGGYPAYLSGAFCVRVGCYPSESEAAAAMTQMGISGSVVGASSTGVLVTVTKSAGVLFEFDCQGAQSLGVRPLGDGAVTWFKGYRYCGGFEYNRVTGGNINVVNVVGLEDYVRGVVPYEMGGAWPLEALKAQAVCARTYVCKTTKHLATYGFDVCNTTDCQVYCGVGSTTASTDSAAAETAGQCLYSNGALAEAVYFSSDGGATENAENVWGSAADYLIGKVDPYEAAISIPNYSYTVTYTASQLTWVLQNSGYSIGTVCNAYVSEFTGMGNVYKVTFVDTAGKTLTVKGEKCRTAFYSSTYAKSVPSMRFTISGGSGGAAGYCVNSSSQVLSSLGGVYAISGSGTVGTIGASSPYAITSSGQSALTPAGTGSSADSFTITGKGSGHNVGMSQYGANAMAKQGCSYLDILNFYYTNVTIG